METFEDKKKKLEKIYKKVESGEPLTAEEEEWMNKGVVKEEEEKKEEQEPIAPLIVIPTVKDLLGNDGFRGLLLKATSRGLSRSNALGIISALSNMEALEELRAIRKLLEEFLASETRLRRITEQAAEARSVRQKGRK